MRALGAIFLIIVLTVSGCASGPVEGDHGRGHPDAATKLFPDVHGLAYDVESDTLWVATHTGLHRRVADGAWEAIGPRQDMMGFSRDPTAASAFWASGHPATGGNLGAIHSTDGGVTWTAVGAAGADFHAMIATPDALYGSTRGSLHRSTDAGATWEEVSLLSAAAFAWADGKLYASTSKDVRVSEDRGASWRTLSQVAAYGLGAADASTLYAGTTGGLLVSRDAGQGWASTTLDAGERTIGHVHVAAGAPRIVHAASYDGAIWRSDDAGATWRALQ